MKKKNNHNKITIETYENAIDKYVNLTTNIVEGELKLWIDKALSYIGKSSKILEIGTGTGRDADYIESLGYNLQRSDFSDGFIEYNTRKGKNTIKLNILDIKIKEKYDFIFANAVLLHFTKQEVKSIFLNMRNILNELGILSFSLQKGEGEKFKFNDRKFEGTRFFKYRQNEEIKNVLNLCGYTVLYLENTDSEKRIHIICKKGSIKS